MTATEQNILTALIDLENAVESMASANSKPDLIGLFGRVDALARELPRDSDPTLLHYLQKKSYRKARLFLQGRERENQAGNCGHV